jgi:para-nitrobenzyl esterase
MELVGAGTVDELRSIPTDIMRKASHAVSGVVPQPGKVHTPANLVWVPVPDELVDAAGFPGWADDVPIMFGTTENEARYFIKPSGPQLPFPRSIGVAILRLVKPNGIYSWAIVKKVATALCGAHAQQVMDILHRSGKTPYECLDWLMTSMIWREPAHQTAERFNALHRPVYCYNFGRVSPGVRTSRDWHGILPRFGMCSAISLPTANITKRIKKLPTLCNGHGPRLPERGCPDPMEMAGRPLRQALQNIC